MRIVPKFTRRGVLALLPPIAGLGLAQVPARRGSIRHFGAITAETMAQLTALVDAYIDKGITSITLNISSPGGDINSAISAYQYLKGRPIDLTTHAFGNCDSAAVVIFCAGTRRLSTPLSRFVIHEPTFRVSNGSFGPAELNERLSTIRQETDSMALILSEITGQPVDAAQDWLKSRVVWTADQALKNNLVQEIRSEIQVGSEPVASIVGPTRVEDINADAPSDPELDPTATTLDL